MKTLITMLMFVFALFVSGCSSHGDYYKSIDAANAKQVEMVQAQAQAETARYVALSKIAESGDSLAKVAATMAIAMGGSQSGMRQPVSIAPQQERPSEALQWVQALSNPISTLGMGYFGMKTNMNASNNSAALGISTNQTFGQMGAQIGTAGIAGYPFVQAPGSTITNTSSGSSVAGGGTVSTSVTDNHASTVDDHSATAPPTVVNPVVVGP